LLIPPREGCWLSEPHILPGLSFWEVSAEPFHRLRLLSGWKDRDFQESISFRNAGFIEFTTNSKSGQMFFFTPDAKLLLKTITRREVRAMKTLLRNGYVEHVTSENGSLLARIYGIYKCRSDTAAKPFYFMLQDNVFFWPAFDIHERYDLKGSTKNRRSMPTEAVLKDLNWSGALELNGDLRQRLVEAHRRDCDFLARGQVLDYSLMVGIHSDSTKERGVFCGRGSLTRSRGLDGVLAFQEKPETLPAHASHQRWLKLKEAVSQDTLAGKYGPFQVQEKRRVLLGIVDYLVPWSARKRAEFVGKCVLGQRKSASCNPPARYAARQAAFVASILRSAVAAELKPASGTEAAKPAGGSEQGAEQCDVGLPGSVE